MSTGRRLTFGVVSAILSRPLSSVFFMDLASIELVILDVDGVLTDGHIVIGPNGEGSKKFHVQDGCAIKLWQRCGGVVAILSGRDVNDGEPLRGGTSL